MKDGTSEVPPCSRHALIERGTVIRDPPPCVAAVLEVSLAAKQPFIYICIVAESPNHAELPQ